jgi:hypothetical protein
MSVNNVCRLVLLFLFSLFFLSTSYSQQNNYLPVWDKHYGGSKDEIIAVVIESPGHGLLLAGSSFSGQSFDLTEPNRDSSLLSSDFWIIRTDPTGNKLWERRFGGSQGETLLHAIAASDGGYLLAGISYSDNDGDVSEPNHDSTLMTPDIWIVKTDSLGNKQWDARFGGSSSEQMGEVVEFSSGKYLIAGSTFSGVSGEVSEPGQGGWDYWMVIIDGNGNYLMDKRFGGSSDEFCTSAALLSSGSFVIGGYSRSGSGGDKTQPGQGGADYWIIRTDTSGNKSWDKSFGGSLNDWLFDLAIAPNKDIILGGQSFSGATGDKSEPNHDAGPNGSDRWIIRADSAGNKLWDKTYGADQIEDVNNIEVLSNGNIMICGESYSSQNGDKSEPNLGPEQTWILMTDSAGTVLWDKTLFTFSHDEKGYTIMSDNDCFITVNYTRADSSGYKTEDNYGEGDFWMIKMCRDSTLSVDQINGIDFNFELWPNPASEYCFIKTNSILNEPVQLYITSMTGRLVLQQSFRHTGINEITVDLSNIPSGLYLLELKTEQNRYFRKLIISH